MSVLEAMVHDDTEQRIYQSYTADCLGTIIRNLGHDNFPLFSEILENKTPHELKPEEIVNHVKQLFS